MVGLKRLRAQAINAIDDKIDACLASGTHKMARQLPLARHERNPATRIDALAIHYPVRRSRSDTAGIPRRAESPSRPGLEEIDNKRDQRIVCILRLGGMRPVLQGSRA